MPLKLSVDRNDPDYLYMHVRGADENASISTYIYVGHSALREVAARLNKFKEHGTGGLCDLEFGKFGTEYAGGALHARLHIQTLGAINITIRLQAEFVPFGKHDVATEATLYTTSVISVLDDFVRAMQAMSDGFCDEAEL
jgi:hypothetical protein